MLTTQKRMPGTRDVEERDGSEAGPLSSCPHVNTDSPSFPSANHLISPLSPFHIMRLMTAISLLHRRASYELTFGNNETQKTRY